MFLTTRTRASLCGLMLLFSPLVASAAPVLCREPKTGSNRAPLVSPPRSAVVIGTGRLQFYSAPDQRCPIAGTFIIPKDDVIIYAQTGDGWSSVTYFGKDGGDDVPGWVRSARLKIGGTMGPSQ